VQDQQVFADMRVRRLTPTECERLQGFPDSYSDIMPKGKPTSDSSRYKALGNSMAVPVMKWIGARINEVNKDK
jgi:DNA (cytosine-5)-methyltransferase 1